MMVVRTGTDGEGVDAEGRSRAYDESFMWTSQLDATELRLNYYFEDVIKTKCYVGCHKCQTCVLYVRL
jgi:hypothetical protein